MNIPQVKRIWTRPFFVHFKTHHCPICDRLQRIKVSKIVNSESEEAKDYDFSSCGGDGYMIGNVKFIWTEFRCKKCSKNFPVKQHYTTQIKALNMQRGTFRCADYYPKYHTQTQINLITHLLAKY